MTRTDRPTGRPADGTRGPRPADPFEAQPLLPDRTRDEDGRGWGEQEYDAEEDLRREAPPHHA